jgi:hypothetical protein
VATKVFQRLTGATLLVLIAACSGTVNAQTDPGPSTRGLQIRMVTTSTEKKVVRYEYNGPVAYVRIETSEPGAQRNEQPYSVDPAQIRAVLHALRLPSEKNESLLNDAEIDEISLHLSRALVKATDSQDVCFAVSGRYGTFSFISPRRVTTARVFRTEGRLNLVFGMVRHDWDSEFKATGTLIAFEPGRRAGPLPNEPQVAIDPAYGESRRADWIVLRDLDSVAAPTATPSTTTAPPAPVPAATAPAATPPAAPPPPAPAATVPPAPAPATPPPAAPPGTQPGYDTIAQRLRTLQKLRDDGLITQQEYEQKRQEILKGL